MHAILIVKLCDVDLIMTAVVGCCYRVTAAAPETTGTNIICLSEEQQI